MLSDLSTVTPPVGHSPSPHTQPLFCVSSVETHSANTHAKLGVPSLDPKGG